MASSRIQELRQKRLTAQRRLAALRRRRQHRLALQQEQALKRIEAELRAAQVEAKKGGFHRERPKHLKYGLNRRTHAQTKRSPGGPFQPRDPLAGVPITPANAADMVRHYRKLLRATFFFTAPHKAYRARLQEALRKAKLYRRGSKKGKRGVVDGQIEKLEQVAQQARGRRDYAQVARSEAMLERLYRARNASEMDPGAAYDAPSTMKDEHIQARDGGSEGEEDTDLSTEEPWWKRYWWVGAAALVGGVLAFRKGKAGRGMRWSRLSSSGQIYREPAPGQQKAIRVGRKAAERLQAAG